MGKILVIGAGGQLGTELTKVLAEKYGNESIIATDYQENARSKFNYCGFHTLNVLNKTELENIVKTEGISQIYHLAAILSAVGEKIHYKHGI